MAPLPRPRENETEADECADGAGGGVGREREGRVRCGGVVCGVGHGEVDSEEDGTTTGGQRVVEYWNSGMDNGVDADWVITFSYAPPPPPPRPLTTDLFGSKQSMLQIANFCSVLLLVW